MGNSYCAAVWKKINSSSTNEKDAEKQPDKTLVFAIVALDNDTVYPTLFFTQNEQERQTATRMLVEDLLAAPITVNAVRGYDPSLKLVIDTWKALSTITPSLSFTETYPICLSYISPSIDELKSSKALVSIEGQGYHLRKATTVEYPLLIYWTRAFLMFYGFLQDENQKKTVDNAPIVSSDYDYIEVEGEFHNGSIYFWCTPDGLPVSMIWRRRPLGLGCSIGYVYTPSEYRGRGYASSMVAAFTIELLKSYKYVNLMVDAKQDLKENLYARVGYRYSGTMIRYTSSISSST
ncbi:hypothetical protein BDA99DRAFT_504855 [Phascolomyces articulosus]|uniref:N-acetyltransferase domain-containing protein n=1 Tax=Phascolomyces articulosus TaxID=60185 RepID=A0AAD5K3P9_9FUNG|nr:hypothetical protein BDA99DRAFT_504855 [Phascolomyces articulosus]